MKLLVPKEKKNSVIKEIRNFLKLDCCSPIKLAGLKGMLISLKDGAQPSHSDFILAQQTSITLSVSLSPMAYQAIWWSDTRFLGSVRTAMETMPQEESQLDWRAYSRILQCKSRPPQPSFRDESQIIVQKRSVQSNPTSVRSNTDGSVRISPEPSNEQLLNNQNE
ncbi:hypothetical protein ACTFIW_008867 [Dictyostelium discoideum]